MKSVLKNVYNSFDYVALFLLDVVGMILELVAARLMSPIFGNSNYVWTAIIGIILLAGSLGNIIGGKIASIKHPRYILGLMLLFAAFYIAIIPVVDKNWLQSIKDMNFPTQFSATLGSIMFFLIPSVILSVFPPILMKEKIGTAKDKGKESGKITAIIAIGSLVGTFLGGFWLIPALGTRMIFALIALTILLISFLVKPLSKMEDSKRTLYIIVSVITFVVVLSSMITVVNSSKNEDVISIDTEYGRIIIESEDNDVLYYKQSGAYSSATYTDERLKYELVFKYLKKYDDMFKYRDVKNALMIGGAAYQYPKYYISHYTDKKMDVVEIDPMSTEIAKKYFYLDDLLADYGDDRLGLYNDDGRLFMSNCDNKYDAILNDAFSGSVPVATMTTIEAARIVHKCLKNDGVYMSNVLGAISGQKGRFLRSEAKTLMKVFEHVYVLPIRTVSNDDEYANWMLVATDSNKYSPDDAVKIDFLDDDIVLTDDYNPIDSMTSTDYFDR